MVRAHPRENEAFGIIFFAHTAHFPLSWLRDYSWKDLHSHSDPGRPAAPAHVLSHSFHVHMHQANVSLSVYFSWWFESFRGSFPTFVPRRYPFFFFSSLLRIEKRPRNGKCATDANKPAVGNGKAIGRHTRIYL